MQFTLIPNLLESVTEFCEYDYPQSRRIIQATIGALQKAFDNMIKFNDVD